MRHDMASFDQQSRCEASQPQTQATAAASPSPASSFAASLDVSLSSSVCAASQQVDASSTRATAPQLSALERVSSDVLVLILQRLTCRCKLAAIARLSRVFRPLPPHAFLHDNINETLWKQCTDLEVWSSRSRTNQVIDIALSVERMEWQGRSTLFTHPRSLCALPQLATLTRLTIYLDPVDDVDRSASVHCMLRSALCLPLLEYLEIAMRHCYLAHPEVARRDNALPSTASLRELKLAFLTLYDTFVYQLCLLPLKELDLHDCEVRRDYSTTSSTISR